MSKYCMQCGKEVEDKINNCPYCGASQNYSFENDKKKKDPVVIIVAGVALVLAVVIVIANLTILNNGYKKPVKNFFKMLETGDMDYIEEVLPEYLLDDIDDDELDEMSDEFKTFSKTLLGDDFDLSYDFVDKKEIDDDDLEELEDTVKEKYDEKVNVSKGYEVETEIIFEIDSESKTETFKINVYKIDGDWCLAHDSLDSLF